MMGDPETRIKVMEVIRDRCSLKTVLKLEKPCPYFGASKTCDDCAFDWMTIADEVLKVVKARRASYEREREKLSEAQGQVDVLSQEVAQNKTLMFRIMDGISALAELVNCMRAKKENEKEAANVGQPTDQD